MKRWTLWPIRLKRDSDRFVWLGRQITDREFGRILKKPSFAPVSLAALVLVQMLTNVWYIAVQQTGKPHGGDEAAHLETFLWHFHHGFTSLRDGIFPPLAPLVSMILHRLFGTSMQISILTNLPFFIALIAGVYGIARRLGGNRAASVFAAVLVTCYPMVSLLSRMAMFELPTAGMAALAVWLLLESEGFARWKVSLLFGLVCGLGELTRESFFVFIAGPVLVEVIRAFSTASWRNETIGRGRRAAFLSAALVAAAAVVGVWWLHDPAAKWHMAMQRATLGPNHPDIRFFSRIGLLFYPYTLMELSVSVWLCLPALAALPWFLRLPSPHRWTILGWIVVPWLVFSNMDWKLARYITAMLPAIAVLTALGLFHLRLNWVRRTAVAATLFAALIVWSGLTFGVVPNRYLIENGWPARVLGFRLFPGDYRQDIHVGPPDRRPWLFEPMLAIIARAATRPQGIAVARFLNTPEMGRKHPSEHESHLSVPLLYGIERDRLAVRLYDFYFDGNGAVLPLWPDQGYAPETIPAADLLICFGPDLPRLLKQEGHWGFIRRFEESGVEKDVYYNTAKFTAAFFAPFVNAD